MVNHSDLSKEADMLNVTVRYYTVDALPISIHFYQWRIQAWAAAPPPPPPPPPH